MIERQSNDAKVDFPEGGFKFSHLSVLVTSLCILMLQVGLTYYISFQILGVLIVFSVIWRGRAKIANPLLILASIIIFCIFLSLTASRVPDAISRNTDNLLITCVLVSIYAFLITAIANLSFKEPVRVLEFFKRVSSVTIWSIVLLIFVTDLSILPFLTRESLISQNVTLIDNWTSMQMVEDNFSMHERLGTSPDIDLFYGEQSYLAAVIFAAITSVTIADRLLARYFISSDNSATNTQLSRPKEFFSDNKTRITILLGAAALIYIQSFSSFFYALVFLASISLANRKKIITLKLNANTALLGLVAIVILIYTGYYSFEYYAHRINTITESQSVMQRFASLVEFGLLDFITGVSNVLILPEFGFHNGILYIIGISGFGGLAYLAFIFLRVFSLSRRIDLTLIAVFCTLGIFMQNGGIFSPSKFVILSLVLIPLSCVHRLKNNKLR